MDAEWLLREAGVKLCAVGIGNGMQEARWLLAQASGRPSGALRPGWEVSGEVCSAFAGLLERRCRGEPLQYILGSAEFYGLELMVGPGVLIPRPETERLVEAALEAYGGSSSPVCDLCTGSGAVALALAHAWRGRVAVFATDISATALGYARGNARRLGLAVSFFEGDLFAPLPAALRFALVTANPPYVSPAAYAVLPSEVRDHEPREALLADEDGLAMVRRLAEEAPDRLAPGGAVVCEISSEQGPRAGALFEAAGYRDVRVLRDYTERDRIVAARWPGAAAPAGTCGSSPISLERPRLPVRTPVCVADATGRRRQDPAGPDSRVQAVSETMSNAEGGRVSSRDYVQELVGIMGRLRGEGGCPWDREQTHASLKRYLIEEAGELLDAIDDGDDAGMVDELGDLLLQLVFHCQIAGEEGRFDFQDAARSECEKMIRRHPHVFGDRRAPHAEAVIDQWEVIKREEKGGRGDPSAVDGVPRSLPALHRAQKMLHKAGRSGFEWPDLGAVLEKVHEELAEVQAALAAGDPQTVREELGDLLLAVVNVCRWRRIEAEDALQQAVRKFESRFRRLEAMLAAEGKAMDRCTPGELLARWRVAAAGAAESAGAGR
ncbi:MAG: nucleoside triphosphate pyrophosphohydrolase [Lentisphaeria bacterium]|nr:nucleoside triphosphate pyrophosphohydrolase [Lentisphaeria bacterium]